MVREFYCAILEARDLAEPSMEVTIRNVPITFSPDELARFLNYERDLTAFPNLPLIEEGRPTKAKGSSDLVPARHDGTEGADEPKAVPLGAINKTTLLKSLAQTRQALNVARVARVRRYGAA
ncbi:hypothetical protein CJ030_MR0G008677 [Morella rubra]|uniref:Uncharacterized protein n=1 Tax=Morella rubra TaxID=262757 RepID=A0A6A1ULI1_9ROSI|nr:hypothetical protein CJ030_MR0G008677 [Morella rubra]